MAAPRPIYTSDNCRVAYQLNWSLSLFWRDAPPGLAWLPELRRLCEADSIRILQHALKPPHASQFLISTSPTVSPLTVAQRVKGRLQHLLRPAVRGAFRRNYSIRSLGSTRRDKLDAYLASQLEHHPMADKRVEERFTRYQIHQPEVDLSIARPTSHATFLYNLHVVFAADGRRREIDDSVLSRVQVMILNAARAKKHLLSRAAVLPDHLHLALGCQLADAPEVVALSYLNNLAYVQGMKAVYGFSYFVGTFGEYDLGVVPRPA